MEGRRGRLIARLVSSIVVVAMLAVTLAPVAAGASASRHPAAARPRFTASATAGAIDIVTTSARSEFPKQLAFTLQAKSTAQISSVRIAYRAGDDPVTTVAQVSLTPASRVDPTYTIDLGHEYYPPGVTIHYQWRVEDQSGAAAASNWADLKVTDPRFFWRDRTRGSVTLHWYDGDDQFADSVLAAATTALANASATARTSVTGPVNVYFYANEQDFRSAMGTNVDPWVGGQTFPLYRLIVLLAPGNDLADAQRSVAHEMTHVAVDSTSEDPFGALPTWLDEGMAVVAEGSLDPSFQQALDSAAQSHTLMSIQSISGNFPESTAGATLAYAESASIVAYLDRSYGPTKLAALIAAFRQGETTDQAFQQAIGMSPLAFQRSWEASLQSASGPASTAPARSASTQQ
ncbi:MAG: peptidase MA family metallohydrolase [Chloroflexota bacterium]